MLNCSFCTDVADAVRILIVSMCWTRKCVSQQAIKTPVCISMEKKKSLLPKISLCGVCRCKILCFSPVSFLR